MYQESEDSKRRPQISRSRLLSLPWVPHGQWDGVRTSARCGADVVRRVGRNDGVSVNGKATVLNAAAIDARRVVGDIHGRVRRSKEQLAVVLSSTKSFRTGMEWCTASPCLVGPY